MQPHLVQHPGEINDAAGAIVRAAGDLVLICWIHDAEETVKISPEKAMVESHESEFEKLKLILVSLAVVSCC